MAGVAGTIVLYGLARDKEGFSFRASLATGYVSLFFLVVTLALGPIRLMTGRRSPPSTDLRRDMGLMAALFAIAHVITGLQVHMGGAMWKYFLDPRQVPQRIVPRLDGFGLANYAGVAATIVLVVLVTISNDVAVRRLGTRRWKSIQRWNYVGTTLVALHAAAYVLIDNRSTGFMLGSVILVAAAIAMQAAGVRAMREQRRIRRDEAIASVDG